VTASQTTQLACLLSHPGLHTLSKIEAFIALEGGIYCGCYTVSLGMTSLLGFQFGNEGPPPWQILHVQAEPITHPMQHRTDDQLWLRVLALYAGHVAGALFWGKAVAHGANAKG
jgi:hypothetical protein